MQVKLQISESQKTIYPKENTQLPLSVAQTQIWFFDQLEPGHTFYNIPAAVRLTGALNVAALKQSLNEIVRRHETLRTTFTTIDGQPVQLITPTLTLTLPIVNWQMLPADEQSVEIQRLATEEVQRPFDLTQKPLMRATLLQLGKEEHVLILVMHHIVSDSSSMEVFIREIAALYEAFVTGKASVLPELSLQYADFANRQRQGLTEEVLEADLSHWKQQLAGATPLLELPTDRPRPAVQTFRGGRRSLFLPQSLTESLKMLSQEDGVTLFMTLLTAFKTLLYRYCDQEDILVGTPIANRNVETENLIGLIANTLVLRTDLSGNPSFRELLLRVRDTTLEAYDHQDIPFEKLVEELQLEHSHKFTPLFQVMFIWQNAPVSKLELSSLTLTPFQLENVTAKFELTLSIAETDAGLTGELVYNCDLFDVATITRMAEHFEILLEGIVANPQQRISQLPLLSAAEKQQLLFEWNNTAAEVPLEQCFPQLFEAQVSRTPNAIAVVFEDTYLTYFELNARANRMAWSLVELGVGPETIVALLCDRNIDFLTAMLAVFKAGGAYLPLNPDHPVDRMKSCLEQSQVSLVLTAREWEPIGRLVTGDWGLGTSSQSPIVNHQSPQLLLIEDLLVQNLSGENLPLRCQPENLAYVIYTSGSTGKPKGAMLEHRGMVNHLYAKIRDLALNATDVVAQTASQSFDISIWQFLVSLVVGGRVEIVSNQVATDPAQLLELVETQKITILEIVPSLLRMILGGLGTGDWRLAIGPDPTQYPVPSTQSPVPSLQLRWLLLTGETLPPQLCRQWLEEYPTIPMLNAYGPTECSDDVTHYPITQPPATGVINLPIGRPILNTQLYILDKELQPLPIGVPGELYVGGVGVGRGYLNNPQLTQQAFVANPFGQQGDRLYKTGDKVRYNKDGNIEFLGRIDYQVKIRGFRIELGEIEAVLLQHAGVVEAVAIVREDTPGNQHLVAYVVPNQQSGVTVSELRSFLKEKLPNYMMPSVFIMLSKIPLTPNGKIDRRALPAPDLEMTRPSFVLPRTPTEEILANLWAEVLNLKLVGIHDNFFELGGHSLLATQVISRLRSLTGVDLPMRRLFESPTIAELSEVIEAAQHTGLGLQTPAIAPIPRNSDLPLSFAQTRLWFLNQLEEESATYNMAEPLRLTGYLQVTALEMAIQEILRRHEILRTTFKIVNGSPVQSVGSVGRINFFPCSLLPAPCSLFPIVDLQHLPEVEQSAQVRQFATEEAQQPFDLSNGPLLRVTLLRLGIQSHVLLLTMHHIVSDGWSMGIFIDELSTLYKAFCAGEPSPLPELAIQYADFAHWQRSWLTGDVLETQLSYWKQQLAGSPPLLELPTDRPRPSVQTFRGSSEHFELNQDLTQKLKTLSQQSGVTLFMTLVAAFVTLLSRYSGQDDIVIGSPIANRNRSEIEPLIGFFVNTLVLRTQLYGNPTFVELLGRVKEMTLDAYAHQDMPFEKLVEELQPERSLSYTPLFQVMFVLQNTLMGKVELPELSMTPFKLDEAIATDDLLLSMEETDTGLTGDFVYNSDLFDSTTITQMVGHFQTLLEGIVANPQQHLAELPLLNAAERHQLLVEWNNTTTEFPLEQCFPQLFEAQVARTPNAVAAVFNNQQMTYFELNARANRWARHLVELGVGPETIVALLVERNLDFLTAMLAVFKAGGAYLPLNPNHPVERMRSCLEQSQVPLVLATRQFEPMVASALNSLSGTPPQILLLEDMAAQQHSDENLPVRCLPENLAYVIYTSGSTGTPKGAMLEHRGMLNHLYAKIKDLDLTANDIVAQTAPQSFDISIWQFLVALLVGGRVHIVPNEMADPAQLLALVESEKISILEIVPSLLRMILQEIVPSPQSPVPSPHLRWLLLTGEALPPQLCRQWLDYYPTIPMLNAYGPTECSDDVTHYPIQEPPDLGMLNLPIGRAVSNTQLYVLDKQLQPVPIGVAGELYVGGVGVGRGYLRNPQQTQQTFIPNPFAQQADSRLYKTGDKVRYLRDGNIEFLGRIDYQVKIRGFRIELQEIEAVLAQHPQVREAVVIAREDQPGNKRLVAYIVSNPEPPTTSILRSFLKEKLPDYMVPAAFVILEKMPLTPNGKVDRKAFPAPDWAHPELNSTFVAPRSPIEEMLAGIWVEILGLEQVGIYDNFFDLGGHSLLATQVISRIRDSLQVELSLRTFFETQTVADLAANIVLSLAHETEDEEMARILAELEEL